MTGASTSGSSQVALEVRDIYRFFRTGDEETLALRGASLSVERGQVVALMGPSGSGKSTLLACTAGLDEPAGGQVIVAGERLSHRSEADRARIRGRRIGVLLQSGNLLAHLDLRSNVKIAQLAAAGQHPHHHPRYNADELLEAVGLSARRNANPSELSGGELARAGLATALANDPDVLLADEPTGELDGDTEQQILELLHTQTERGCGLLVVTHSVAVAHSADRIVTIDNGRVRS